MDKYSPVTLSTSTLLGLGWIGVGMAGFGEVTRKARLSLGRAISNAGVVAVSELVGASHCNQSVYETTSRYHCH
jgi:hypothetical protein